MHRNKGPAQYAIKTFGEDSTNLWCLKDSTLNLHKLSCYQNAAFPQHWLRIIVITMQRLAGMVKKMRILSSRYSLDLVNISTCSRAVSGYQRIVTYIRQDGHPVVRLLPGSLE
jgi:hypothetical protein